jgi:TPR repeat protein
LSLDDGVAIDAYTINKAKNNDGQALRDIGYEYMSKKEDYSKSMAWYQLAANQNDLIAYNNIGFLYRNGLGVSRDYITSMEYCLKAASCNDRKAMTNIGILFSNGKGIPVDKYKALEWLTKGGTKPEKVKELNQEGIHLKKEDKSKLFYEFDSCY